MPALHHQGALGHGGTIALPIDIALATQHLHSLHAQGILSVDHHGHKHQSAVRLQAQVVKTDVHSHLHLIAHLSELLVLHAHLASGHALNLCPGIVSQHEHHHQQGASCSTSRKPG